MREELSEDDLRYRKSKPLMVDTSSHSPFAVWPEGVPPGDESNEPGPRIATNDIQDDLLEIKAWFPGQSTEELEKCLAAIHEPVITRADGRWSLTKSFTAWDAEADKKQRAHVLLIRVSGILAVLAVIVAILQLPRSDWEHYGILEWPVSRWIAAHSPLSNIHSLFEGAEVASALLAIVAVTFGIWSAWSHLWQVRRLQAEQCRFLKFGYLLRCATSASAASSFLNNGLQKLHALDAPEAQPSLRSVPRRWVRHDLELVTVDDAPAGRANPTLLPFIVEYFVRKRIRYQAAYFKRQTERREAQEEFSKWLPVVLFFLSLVAAILHFVGPTLVGGHGAAQDAAVAAEQETGESPHSSHHSKFELGCLLLAAALPAVGAGIRIYRGALEFGRNANRFHSMWVRLRHFEVSLVKCRKSGDIDEQLNILRNVEIALESEHRSWTRLMVEAEWFG